jgi:hypothetical protein
LNFACRSPAYRQAGGPNRGRGRQVLGISGLLFFGFFPIAKKFLHHSLPDLRAFYFSLSSFLKMEFDAIDNFFDQIDTDRPFFTGFFQAIEDFKAIERLPSPVLLHHQWEGIFGSLAGGKSLMTA